MQPPFSHASLSWQSEELQLSDEQTPPPPPPPPPSPVPAASETDAEMETVAYHPPLPEMPGMLRVPGGRSVVGANVTVLIGMRPQATHDRIDLNVSLAQRLTDPVTLLTPRSERP